MEGALRGAEKGYAGYHEAPFLRDLHFDQRERVEACESSFEVIHSETSRAA